MKVFADTYFFLALVNYSDPGRPSAAKFAAYSDLRIVTTWPVLLEFADGMCAHGRRHLAVSMIKSYRQNPKTELLPISETQIDVGLRLFAQRPDKDWSLTDCISFVAMEEHGITEALTADKHFEQAGFTALLRE